MPRGVNSCVQHRSILTPTCQPPSLLYPRPRPRPPPPHSTPHVTLSAAYARNHNSSFRHAGKATRTPRPVGRIQALATRTITTMVRASLQHRPRAPITSHLPRCETAQAEGTTTTRTTTGPRTTTMAKARRPTQHPLARPRPPTQASRAERRAAAVDKRS